jgi:hypothetical protein
VAVAWGTQGLAEASRHRTQRLRSEGRVLGATPTPCGRTDPGPLGEQAMNIYNGRLEILNGGFEGMTYELTTEEIVIGRNPATELTLLDEGISREHALVILDEDAPSFVIEDLPSTNGTKVNGKRMRSAPLCEGDEIQIGLTLFRFIYVKDENSPPSCA